MKTVVGMATTAERLKYARKAIESLEGQVDEIILYNNGEEMVDLTDNGKFWGLEYQEDDCYYFSCDDDLIYPSNYIEKLIEEIEETKCIVTHHGRILRGTDRSYYRGHYAFACLQEQPNKCTVDVAGTGVTGFKKSYFSPYIWGAEDKMMSDLVFSLEAAKQGKKIMIMPHKNNWIKYQNIPDHLTIHNHFMNKERPTRQMEIANEIFRMR